MLNMTALLDDAFSVFRLTAALRDVPYVPNFLETLRIFEDKPIDTDIVKIEKDGDTLKLVPITPRGSPVPQRTRNPRSLRAFETVRIANGDVVRASELFRVRAFGTDSEMETLANEVLRRQTSLRNDNNLTQEFHRLGAIQGIVLDSDGTSVIINWFDEWGITANTEIDFDLDTAGDGLIANKVTEMKRGMIRNSAGTWSPGVRIYALCGDSFYDKLRRNSEIRTTYLNQIEAAQLRAGVEPFEYFDYAGVRWFNYQGTDDNTTVAIGSDKAKLFPVGVPGLFQRALSPGERLADLNTLGEAYYSFVIPDTKRDQFVEMELYSYPLYIVTRPKMLYSGHE